NCGMPYYIGGVIKNEDDLLIQTPESFHARFNVDVRVNNEVLSVNSSEKTVKVLDHSKGKEYAENYDVLVLSPGAYPYRPPINGVDKAHVFTLRNLIDTKDIRSFINQHKPQSAVIIGGGYIGIEMAENLKESGIRISIVEASSHILKPLDEDMAHFVQRNIRSHEIGLYLNSKAGEITDNEVVLENGTHISADIVILSTGTNPETGFLKNSGINLGDRGEIIVNDRLETSVKGVYALGDASAVTNIVTGQKQIVPLASPVNKQARIAGDVICGKNAKYSGAQGTSIIKVFNLTAAVTGESEYSLKSSNLQYLKSYTVSTSIASYYPGAETMYIKLLFDSSGIVLGAQIVGGKGVDKRIDVLATAIRARMTIYDLQELELAYAPPYSSAKDPVNMAGFVAGNILEGMMKPFYPEDIDKIDKNGVLVDVRTPGEFSSGHIPGAVNIPVDNLRENLNSLDKSKNIYLYCRIAQRGYIAQRILEQDGYNTKNLAGGYLFYDAMVEDK
ncbi:MAG: FAD-dependent oxidoreductase, partial [Bacillota bacterium]|nr:FAD-dependent oxidoreductase [Bacillota bacterium]